MQDRADPHARELTFEVARRRQARLHHALHMTVITARDGRCALSRLPEPLLAAHSLQSPDPIWSGQFKDLGLSSS
jgi:hypothetical protein